MPRPKDFDEYKQMIDKEILKIKKFLKERNMTWPESKIKYVAKQNVEKPKGDGWRN